MTPYPYPWDPVPGPLFWLISCLSPPCTFWNAYVLICFFALHLPFHLKVLVGEKLMGKSAHQSTVPVCSALPTSCHPPTRRPDTIFSRQYTLPILLYVLIESAECCEGVSEPACPACYSWLHHFLAAWCLCHLTSLCLNSDICKMGDGSAHLIGFSEGLN